MKLLPIRNLFRRRRSFSRAAVRYACTIEGSLIMMDRVVTFTGRVIDLSAGGALFRPRLTYLLDRRDVPVCLSVGGEELFGRIVGTSPNGFGVNFDEALDEATLQRVLAASTSPVDARDSGGQAKAA